MRQIPMKNYVIAIIISIITVGLVFYLMNIYNSRDSKIDFIDEVSEKDLDYYVAERSEILIYMTSAKKAKNIEKEFKKYLNKKVSKDNYAYIDLNEVSKDFKDNFNDKYSKSNKIEITDPSLILIENGRVEDSLINIKEFKQIKDFIERSNIK